MRGVKVKNCKSDAAGKLDKVLNHYYIFQYWNYMYILINKISSLSGVYFTFDRQMVERTIQIKRINIQL